jgi:lysozyme
MVTSPAGIAIIKRHEGVSRRPYRCPAGLWTVGVGHLLYPEQARLPMPDRLVYPLAERDNRTLSDAEVDALLPADLRRFERGVARLCPAAIHNQHQLDALVSFSFNVGLGALQRSTLRQKFNRSDVEGASGEFLRYVKSGGRTLPGLKVRRVEESKVFAEQC